MNKRHYEHTLPNIRGSLSNTYLPQVWIYMIALVIVGWNLPAVRKGLNKDTDSSNKQKENR